VTDAARFTESLGDPCPEAATVPPPREGERVEFAGTVRQWLHKPLVMCKSKMTLDSGDIEYVQTFLQAP
jgi:hypothetical protein